MTISKKRFNFLLFSVLFSLSILIWTLPNPILNIFLYAFLVPWIIILFNLGFVVTLIISIVKWIRKGFRSTKIELIVHGLVFLLIAMSLLIQSELFKPEIVLKADLVDDLSRIELILRENDVFEMTVSGILFQETKKGNYTIENDTLIFSVAPYDNDFIPLKVLLLPDKNRIYFDRKENGEIDTTDNFASYFEIYENKLTVK